METIKIKDQEWMTENLNVDTFRNGDAIPEAKSDDEWRKAQIEKKPAWCHYENDPSNGEKYGKLYNWYAVNDPRGLAPEGWHVPSEEEWKALCKGAPGPTKQAGKTLRSEDGWIHSSDYVPGSNESGFSAKGTGRRSFAGGFSEIGCTGTWWSTSEDEEYAERGYPNVISWWMFYWRYKVETKSEYKSNGFAVRCLKD